MTPAEAALLVYAVAITGLLLALAVFVRLVSWWDRRREVREHHAARRVGERKYKYRNAVGIMDGKPSQEE